MPQESMVTARLSLVEGKYTQPPNVVLVPVGVKKFPVTVEWSMVTAESYVVGSHDPEDAHLWCVLDEDLKQVMRGSIKAGRKGSKKAEPTVACTLHGGGAGNPSRETIEFIAARLKNGVTYTLVASRHGQVAVGEFVAVAPPKPRKRVAGKKAAKKRAPVKKPAKKRAAKKKAA